MNMFKMNNKSISYQESVRNMENAKAMFLAGDKNPKLNSKNINTVTFQLTEDCNLNCTYCYQINKSPAKLSFEYAKKFIDLLIEDSYKEKTYFSLDKTSGVIAEFIGGEPLLEIELLDKIVDLLPEKKSKKYDDTIEFCLIGQPNVGKSSLTNAILGTERVIVSDIAGTTRDAIDTPFTRDGADYVVIDTAGIRKSGKIYENAEKYSFLRAIKAIERSSVVLLLLDATKEIEEQDKRVAGYAMDANKAVIIVVNKWDAVDKDDKSMQEWIKKIKSHFVFLDYAPIVFVSALKNQRVHTVFEQIKIVYQNYTRRVATNVLNDVLLDATLIQQAPFFNGDRLKIYYASQVEKNPPSFVLFVNDPNYLHFSYQRYLENKLREAFSFEGTPIKFILRKKED